MQSNTWSPSYWQSTSYPFPCKNQPAICWSLNHPQQSKFSCCSMFTCLMSALYYTFISNRFNYISFQERIQGIKYELLDVRRTHFYCWVHWKYETKSQQKPLLSTHLGAKSPRKSRLFGGGRWGGRMIYQIPVGTGFEMRRKIFPALVFRRFCGMLE